jgi:hypothetical protein
MQLRRHHADRVFHCLCRLSSGQRLAVCMLFGSACLWHSVGNGLPSLFSSAVHMVWCTCTHTMPHLTHDLWCAYTHENARFTRPCSIRVQCPNLECTAVFCKLQLTGKHTQVTVWYSQWHGCGFHLILQACSSLMFGIHVAGCLQHDGIV